MNLMVSVLLLGVLGVFVGAFLGALVKKRRSASQIPEEKLSAEQLRNLAQLKDQLESGLVTKEEYHAKRQKILNEL